MSSDMKSLEGIVVSVMDSPVWGDDALFKLYLYCLSRASHNSCLWHGIRINPGDMPMSLRNVAEALSWSRNKLDRKLKQLHETGLVSVERIPQSGVMLHFLNWPQNGASRTETGSTMETRDFQNGASSGQDSSRMEPVFQQNGASCPATGSTMEPNPIYKNKTSQFHPAPMPELPGFADVWSAYPACRRIQRSAAAAAVTKALKDGATIPSILEALEADKQSAEWRQDDGRYIPGIVKWLQKETWRNYLRPDEPKEDDEHWISR